MNLPTAISKEEVMSLPLGGYTGEVVIAATEKSIQESLTEINQFSVVGFDTEARPTFKKGQVRKVSLVQVSTDKKVYLFRLKKTGLIPELIDFLENRQIIKVGIGLEDDMQLLQRLASFEPAGFLDLNTTMKTLGAENIGARNLSAMFLKVRISKSAQTSNWENETLTEKQIRYAATDAWICLEIYKKLNDWGYV